jgi:hypothetical protein
MKNQIIKIVLLSFISFCFFNTAHANTAIHLKISTPVSTIYDQNITVITCDSDNNSVTPAIATPYCAILQLQPGIQSSWSWSTSFGGAYYLNSLNNISGSSSDIQGNTVYNYWDWYLNGTEAITGLSEYTLQPGDIISLNFLDPGHTLSSAPTGGAPLVKDMIPNPLATVSTTTPDTTTNATTTPTLPPAKPSFDVQKAYDFLTAQQNTEGSWGSDLYTDWAAMALASGNNQTQVLKLVKYLSGTKIEGLNLTDYERHAMALMALGLNPYNTNGINYIEKITSSFDGKQFGDANQDNNDIFALIVLQNAGYTQNDPMINTDINFVLSAQNTNGSWDGSVDMTGAAIEALAGFKDPKIQNALAKAEDFLKQNQKDDGSWNDNASSTAWALEGILALNEKPEDWSKNGNSPFDYLATIQDTDGGVKDESLDNKIWETAYVVSALSGKTWNKTIQNFEKPITPAIIQTPKKLTEKKALTASVINAATPITTTSTTENPTPKKNWFVRLLDSIFGN